MTKYYVQFWVMEKGMDQAYIPGRYVNSKGEPSSRPTYYKNIEDAKKVVNSILGWADCNEVIDEPIGKFYSYVCITDDATLNQVFKKSQPLKTKLERLREELIKGEQSGRSEHSFVDILKKVFYNGKK